MNTSARMLRLLSLLQTHRYWPGAELSGRLEVSPRTLRRDIDRLRELGYVVDAVRGVAGGYQLRAGAALPPLLLEDDEAVAIAVALRTATSSGEDTSLQALTKVIALMPPRLRRRMDALRSQTDGVPWVGGPTIDAGVLTVLAQACRDDEPVAFGYTTRDQEASQRRVEPHRLVSLGRRWYLVGYDRDRQDWRSFRVDRISAVTPSGQRFRPRELPAADAPAFVAAGIRSMAHRYDVRFRIAPPRRRRRGGPGPLGDDHPRRPRLPGADADRQPRLAADGARPAGRRLHRREPARAGRRARLGGRPVRARCPAVTRSDGIWCTEIQGHRIR